MKHSTRTKLFIALVALFIVAAPLVVLYSQGYRVDFENRLVVKTGALFLEPRPAPVEVYINGKLRKRSNFLFQNIYIGDLLPKNYVIEIRKEGYLSWKKELDVLPKLVTEAKNIMLFRASLTPSFVTYNAADFYFAPSKNYIAIVEKNQTPKINLYDIKQQKEFLLLELNGTSTDQTISQIEWNSDSSRLAVRIKGNDAPNWLIIDSQNYVREKVERVELGIAEYVKDAAMLSIKQVFWSKDNPEEMFLLASDNYARSFLFKYNDRIGKLLTPLAIFNPLLELKSIQLLGNERIVVLTENGDAYLYDLKTLQPEKIAGGIKKISASPDGKKLLLVADYTIWVYWLSDVHVQPFHDTGDRLQIVRTNSPIFDAAWFSKSGKYIAFTAGDSILVIELDRRGGQNIYSLVNVRAQNIFYDQNKDALYYLSESTLYALYLE